MNCGLTTFGSEKLKYGGSSHDNAIVEQFGITICRSFFALQAN